MEQPLELGSARSVRTAVQAGTAARRAELTERSRAFAKQARTERTWSAYEARWSRFERWCETMGERSLAAEPLTVANFLTGLAPEWRPATPADPPGNIVEGLVLVRAGLRPGSIAGYLAAISVAHQGAGVEQSANPARHEVVRRVMAGIRRHPGGAPSRRRTALRPTDMAAIIGVLRPEQRLADARDAALLLIGWKAALRTDDLHRLDVTDVRVDDDGLSVHLRRSKTDQVGAGDVVGIAAAAADDPLDAVAAWQRWRNRLASHGIHTGPAWRAIDRYGARPRASRMSTKALSDVVTRRAAVAGLVGDYGGHSLRRGFATSALAGGAAERAVQRHGRWASPVSMSPYIDEAERFAATNPTRFLQID